RRRPHGARRADGEEHERPAFVEEGLDALEVGGVERLAEPDDVGPQQTLAAIAAREPVEVERLVGKRRAIAAAALAAIEAAMQLDHARGPGARVQPVDVL